MAPFSEVFIIIMSIDRVVTMIIMQIESLKDTDGVYKHDDVDS